MRTTRNHKKQDHKEIKKSLKELNKNMSTPVSVGEGYEYYQMESGYNTDVDIRECMKKMINIIQSLNYCSQLTNQKFNSVMGELQDMRIRIARLEGHDNMH